MGIGEDHANLPYLLQVSPLFLPFGATSTSEGNRLTCRVQWLYSWTLHQPHQDKAGLEYLLQRASTVLPTPTTHLPDETLLRPSAYDPLKTDYLPEIIIVRPALLMGDGSAAEQPRGPGSTKVGQGQTVWTVNRAEVGRVIVDECVTGDKWVNKLPTVGW